MIGLVVGLGLVTLLQSSFIGTKSVSVRIASVGTWNSLSERRTVSNFPDLYLGPGYPDYSDRHYCGRLCSNEATLKYNAFFPSRERTVQQKIDRSGPVLFSRDRPAIQYQSSTDVPSITVSVVIELGYM